MTRTLRILQLAVAFLTLEDGLEEAREAAWDAQILCRETPCSTAALLQRRGSTGSGHPHRRAAHIELRDRRPGTVKAHDQVCTCSLPPLGVHDEESDLGTMSSQRTRAPLSAYVGETQDPHGRA